MFVDPQGLVKGGPLFGMPRIFPTGPKTRVPVNSKNFPQGSKGGPGAGKNFPKSDAHDPKNMPNCTYCGQATVKSQRGCPTRHNKDHVIPRSKGGNNTPDNKAPACQSCNSSKGDRTPKEWHEALPPKYPRTDPPAQAPLARPPVPPTGTGGSNPGYDPDNPPIGAPGGGELDDHTA